VNEHDAIARIKRLSHSINCADEIAEVIERLIKERDEARRRLCVLVDAYGDGTTFANKHGWDCFEQEDGK
jgi:hypothetical protein